MKHTQKKYLQGCNKTMKNNQLNIITMKKKNVKHGYEKEVTKAKELSKTIYSGLHSKAKKKQAFSELKYIGRCLGKAFEKQGKTPVMFLGTKEFLQFHKLRNDLLDITNEILSISSDFKFLK